MGSSGGPGLLEKVRSELATLRAALVQPYVRHFNDHDAPGQNKRVAYWVVAVEEANIVFYDEGADEFGLAVGNADEDPDTVNVRGDLPSVFMSR